ncbi:Iron-sulfur cluster-binding domain-containing protein [Anaerosporobacter mobilis DSM 15930]|uniref:Iron-sulfur cluster-binding domain-containing protein n=1 Tax=Anaerosporobacter mobilis DSM 15930 TaxID=1120996 RepID=A0A1M7LNF7_9FIRM|nr:radical SAM/SPASM domain-containing protein [Anaerosporobacter mobilis]SHM79784.1 Iron-sulfur cluster-binding domain-containing protein [Anaerosporobacter mobilis DSM 15930]
MSITDKINSQIIVDNDLYPSYIGRTLNIEITSQCNERCIYCQYYAKGSHKNKRVIDDEFFYRITKEAYDLGITDVGLYITAEPLMNPKVYDYVHYLKHIIGFKYVYISTNGILLTPKNLEKLAAAGIDSIKFSVSGSNPETFEKHHGINAFSRVYENIKYAYQYRKEKNLNYKLYMFSILTEFNKNEKKEIEATYGPYVDELVISNVIANRSVKGVKEYLCLKEEDYSITHDLVGKLPCKSLFNRITINEKGDLLACCFDVTSNLTVIADLNNTKLKDAVYSKEFVELRRKHIENKIENTICNFCLRGIKENIYSMVDNMNINSSKIQEIDLSSEIKSRFDIV